MATRQNANQMLDNKGYTDNKTPNSVQGTARVVVVSG